MGSSLGRSVALAMVVGAGMAGTGCTGTKESCARGAGAAEMAAQLRRERHTVRNLENEVVLLRAQLRDRPAVEQVAVMPPEPPPVQESNEPLQGGFGDSPYGGDVEVVYEGEAARESKNRPSIQIYETPRVASGLTQDGAANGKSAAPAVRAPVGPIPEVGTDRLQVVPGRPPTVDEQLRRARAVTGAEGGVVATVRPSSSLVPRAPGGFGRVIIVPAPASSDGSADLAITSTPAALPAATASSAPAAAIEEEATVPSAKSLYRRGMAALHAGRSDRAVAPLRQFLQHYPRHYLADNVQYGLAESFYARDRYGDALAEYNRLVQRYWRGNKLPDALLKVGLCELALGRHDTGMASLRKLVARFPQTRPARAARARLAEGGRR